LLKEKLGFDDAFNYKEETDLNSALTRLETSKSIFQVVMSTKKEKASAHENHSMRKL
jgi:hypothetical protein